eukprot:Skav216065  [mRNA]  locus=scaffold2261:155190:164816:- [translate_table: standard]
MAITCEDAVRRIDELCAVTQHLLRELDVYGWGEPKETPPVPPANHVPQRVPPLLPQREREAPSEAETVSNQLLRSVSSYVPAPLGTRSVMLPCDRCWVEGWWMLVDAGCIDMDAFTSTCTASAHDKHRIGHELQSGLLHQRLCAVYARVAADGHGLTWSCFAELQLQSPTEPQIYVAKLTDLMFFLVKSQEVYSHFDPELQLASLTPLESICLCETLLRASLHGTADDSPVLLGDHPTKLAEKWVEDGRRFAQGSKSKLNTSESLCLLDALCRAILHCHADSRGSAAERVAAPGATASTAASEGQAASLWQPGQHGDTAKSTMVWALVLHAECRESQLLLALEPKALATARSWVESAAKNLPLFEGTLDLGPQQFASMALRVYCEHFAGLQRLRFRDSEELQHFVRLALTTTGALPAAQPQLALQAVTPLAEHIDLHGAGELDITQCLVLADGVLRWISEKVGKLRIGNQP